MTRVARRFAYLHFYSLFGRRCQRHWLPALSFKACRCWIATQSEPLFATNIEPPVFK